MRERITIYCTAHCVYFRRSVGWAVTDVAPMIERPSAKNLSYDQAEPSGQYPDVISVPPHLEVQDRTLWWVKRLYKITPAEIIGSSAGRTRDRRSRKSKTGIIETVVVWLR